MFKVKYMDNTGTDDSIAEFATKEEAENAIEEELESIKEWFYSNSYEYDYGDFYGEFGMKTEIWAVGNDDWACWERLYE